MRGRIQRGRLPRGHTLCNHSSLTTRKLAPSTEPGSFLWLHRGSSGGRALHPGSPRWNWPCSQSPGSTRGQPHSPEPPVWGFLSCHTQKGWGPSHSCGRPRVGGAQPLRELRGTQEASKQQASQPGLLQST